MSLRNIPELLENYVGTDKIIKNTDVTKMAEAGAGSEMLKLIVVLENKNDHSEETLHTVVKIIPDSEFAKKLFDFQITYTNEMGFYDTVIPTIQNFQKEMGTQGFSGMFPKCIAARRNMTGGTEIGEDTALVLEDLKASGYKTINRMDGYDFESAKLILKDMAKFHAVPLALKIKHPEIFEEKVKVFCKDYDPKNMGMNELVGDLLRRIDEVASWAPKIPYWGEIERSRPREPFATLIHTDMQPGNVMLMFENGNPVSNKFIDFQLMTYGSPAADVFFFIWCSVQLEVIQPHLDYLLKYYHEQFINVLKQHKVDVSLFSFQHFLKEIELEAHYELGHAALFYSWCATKIPDESLSDFNPAQYSQFVLDNASPQLKKKLSYMVRESVLRGWLE